MFHSCVYNTHFREPKQIVAYFNDQNKVNGGLQVFFADSLNFHKTISELMSCLIIIFAIFRPDNRPNLDYIFFKCSELNIGRSV